MCACVCVCVCVCVSGCWWCVTDTYPIIMTFKFKRTSLSRLFSFYSLWLSIISPLFLTLTAKGDHRFETSLPAPSSIHPPERLRRGGTVALMFLCTYKQRLALEGWMWDNKMWLFPDSLTMCVAVKEGMDATSHLQASSHFYRDTHTCSVGEIQISTHKHIRTMMLNLHTYMFAYSQNVHKHMRT